MFRARAAQRDQIVSGMAIRFLFAATNSRARLSLSNPRNAFHIAETMTGFGIPDSFENCLISSCSLAQA